MTPSDIAAARDLWATAAGIELAEGDSPGQIAGFLARNPGMSTVAVAADGSLVGAVLCGHDGRRGWAYHLAVRDSHRGQGVGRAIMQRSLAALKAEGLERALLFVAADNDGGRRFWLREGWETMPFAQPMGIDL